jgi:hypothetical protein
MAELQALCQQAQEQLVAMQYLAAEELLARAESLAFKQSDFDTLARLYMPLQECRRQKRLLCSEGVVKLDLIARDANEALDPKQIAHQIPQGQLLVAGWASIAPAVELRAIAAERQLYLETFLAAVYEINGGGRAVAIVPSADVALPPSDVWAIDQLIQRLPAHSIVLPSKEIPTGQQRGTAALFAQTAALWEKLHRPFLAQADAAVDPHQRIKLYKKTIAVDYACELAHQNLSHCASKISRSANRPVTSS